MHLLLNVTFLLNLNNFIASNWFVGGMTQFPHMKISSWTNTHVQHIAGNTKSLHRINTHTSWKQKAHLITHTHTHTESTRQSRHIAQTPSPLPLPFSSVSPSSHQIHLEASVWLADCFLCGSSCSASLLCLGHLINCQSAGEGLKRSEIKISFSNEHIQGL